MIVCLLVNFFTSEMKIENSLFHEVLKNETYNYYSYTPIAEGMRRPATSLDLSVSIKTSPGSPL